MSENPFVPIDYLTEARSRVTQQFLLDSEGQGSVIFDKYLQLLLDQKIQLQNTFQDLLQLRSIDTATGAQLDLIGDIVGQPRELIDTALLTYFAFQGYSNAASYGDLNDASLGGTYYSYGNPLSGNTLLTDDQYRLFIKAKIIKNTTSVTPNQFIDFLAFVLDSNINLITAEGGAEFTVMIGKSLSSFEKVLLTYVSYTNGYPSRFIPKPIGVKVNFGTFDSTNYFGFQGAPSAKGYGDINNLSLGGVYAQLL